MTLRSKDIIIKYKECLILRQPREYGIVKRCLRSKYREIIESCIFDEIKPYFNIRKTGREYVDLGNKYAYIQKVPYNDKYWFNDFKLNNEEKYTDEVLKILLFRKFYGLPFSLACLRLRLDLETNSDYYITWDKDFYPKGKMEEYEIPFRFVAKTIKKYKSLNDLLLEMTKVKNVTDVDNLVKVIKKKVIEKYDTDYLFLVSYTRNKLLELIQ